MIFNHRSNLASAIASYCAHAILVLSLLIATFFTSPTAYADPPPIDLSLPGAPSSDSTPTSANPSSTAVDKASLPSAGSSSSNVDFGSAGEGKPTYDMTMRDMVVTCDTKNTSDSCPPKPMPMIETPLKSYIKDYSPYLYYTLPDPNNPAIPYTGTHYRGTAGDRDIAHQEFGNPVPGQKRLTACVPQIKLPAAITSKEDIAKYVRLEMDNCANQFIMNLAITPFQKANAVLLSGDNAKDPAEQITPENRCQLLKTIAPPEEEYLASDYLEAAWIKTLNDPAYRKNKNADLEPRMPDKIGLKNTTEKATKLPNPFPEVKLTSISTAKFEEILDPTHPFSPRWDFKWNDRDNYSPKTKAYSGDDKNAVFCAGTKNDVTKVDIMTFRETALKFDQHVNDRIEFNKSCMANTGVQANPCCKFETKWKAAFPVPIPYTVCTPLPCAECYKMTAAEPVCSTTYSQIPDRKSVDMGGPWIGPAPPYKLPHTIYPVPPGPLRGMVLPGAAMTNMAIAAIDANTPIGAVKAAVSSQLTLIKSLSNIATPQGLTDALKYQLKVAINIPNIPNLDKISDLMNMPQNLINKYSDMTIGQAQNLIDGQLKVMDMVTNLTKGGTIDLSTSLSALAQSTGMLKGLPSTKTIDDIKHLLDGQTNLILHLPIDQPLQQALSGLKSINSMVTGLSDLATSPEKAKELLKASISIMGGMPSGTLVGAAQNAIKGQLEKFSNLSVNMKFGDAITQVNLDASLGSLKANISADTPIGEVNALLNSQLDGLSDHDPTAPVKDFANILEAHGKDILKLPAGTPLDDIANLTKSSQNAISEMAKNLPLKDISGALNPMIKGLSSLDGGIKLGNLGGMTDELQKNLKSLGATLGKDLKLDDVKKFMDSQIGGVLKMPGLDKLDLKQFNDIIGAQQGILKQVTGAAKGVTDAISGATAPITKAISDVTGAMKTQMENITKSITGGINGAIGGAMDGMKNTIGAVTGVITKQLDAINKIAAAPTNAIGAAGAKIDEAIASSVPGMDVAQAFSWVAVLAANYPPEAKCIPNESSKNDPPMAALCKDLRKPLAMINKLKMRYHNPDEPDTQVLTEGVPEGLTFKEYVGDHMPYPRLWDTGTSIQKKFPKDDLNLQAPDDTSGQYTAIVGVGREATPKSMAGTDAERKDERCLAGGWGSDVSFGGISIKKSDPITSWTELKLYQSRTYRDWGLACIGRYEKVYKIGSTENIILAQLGAEWSHITVTKCPNKPDGSKDIENCTFINYKDYIASGGAAANAINTTTHYSIDNYPLGWRGYISSKKEENRFPNFGGTPTLRTGLDTADLGDIILFPTGSGKEGDKPGLPKIAKVSQVYRCDGNKNCYIEVAEVDNGKYPDICGSTDHWGEVKTRRLYKPGKMDADTVAQLKRINSTINCEDTKLQNCELSTWDKVKFYRSIDDVRSGCDKIKASECK